MGVVTRSRRSGAVAPFIALGLLVGCGDDADPSPVDAAVPSDAGWEGAPQIPWLVDGVPPIAPVAIAPCPAGWREVDDGAGTVVCDPYPASGAETCGEGEAHFPGEPGCAPVGSACPAGPFADGLPADRPVVHVLAGATGGDGSLGRPYGAFTDFALGSLPAGAVIALGEGTYDAILILPAGLTLWGACAARTVITTTVAHAVDPVLWAVGTGVTIRDLTVGPAPRPGVVVGAGGSLTAEGLVVEATRVGGMFLLGELEARVLLVRDTGPRAFDLELGRGLLVQGGARAVVEGAVIEGNTDFGVSVVGAGTSLAISDAVIRDTAPRRSTGLGGAGLVVDVEATVTASRLLIERNLYAALIAYGAASVDVTHGVFRDTESSSGGARGNGAAVEESATVRLAATLLERNRDTGLLVRAGAEATLTDLVVRETEPQRSDDRYGWGLSVESASRATLERGLLEGNRDLGIFAAHEGTTLAARDLVVRDTRPRPDGRFGRGLTSVQGASTTFGNALFEGNREIALLFADSGTVAELTDVVARDTLPDESTGAAGRALSVQDSAALRLSRSLLERNPGLSLMAALSADLSAEDLVIRGTDGPAAGERGRGLVVQQGATARVLRGLLEGTRDAAVLVIGDGTSAEMEGVRILGTRAQDCASCVRPAGGTALVSVYHAAVTLRDFEIRGADLCGVLLAEDGEIDLFDGRVAGCAIGGCLQVPGYDLERLSSGVAYQDNGTNLDATSLPVPEATTPSLVGEMP